MIENQLVKAIIQEWSFWIKSPKAGVARQCALPKALASDIVLLIQGVRRCGKSTLLTQLPSYYDLDLQHCYFCNFEDPRLLESLNHSLLSQIVSIAREQIPIDEPCYFFLDEIQHVEGWEKWIHTQLERPQNNYFILTGSNSCLLSGEFGTALTGRHITLTLYPFSFSEYQSVFPKKSLEDYLMAGGFPRTLTYDHPKQLLQEYFNDIILRDVYNRVQARSHSAVQQVVKMAFETCGSELSYRKIASVTGLTVDTVKTYLEASEQAYLLFECPYFSYSEKKKVSRQKKFYPIDVGLRHAVTNTSQRDFGKSLEMLVFLRLTQLYGRVYYWSEIHQGEVDFIVEHNQKIIPFQVTWANPKIRHEKALDFFYTQYPHASEAVFITQENAVEFLLGSLNWEDEE